MVYGRYVYVNINNTETLCGRKEFKDLNAAHAYATLPLQCLFPTPFPCPKSFASNDCCTHIHIHELIQYIRDYLLCEKPLDCILPASLAEGESGDSEFSSGSRPGRTKTLHLAGGGC